MEKAKPKKTASGGKISNIFARLAALFFVAAFFGLSSYALGDWGLLYFGAGAFFGACLPIAVKFKRKSARNDAMIAFSFAFGLLFMAVAEYLGA